jgi:hypothetical protein
MRYFLQVYRSDRETLNEDGWIPAEKLPYPSLLLERLVSVGAIEPRTGMLSQADAGKVEKILRLRRCLGVNLSGAVIITELMERLDAMELEINRRIERRKA